MTAVAARPGRGAGGGSASAVLAAPGLKALADGNDGDTEADGGIEPPVAGPPGRDGEHEQYRRGLGAAQVVLGSLPGGGPEVSRAPSLCLLYPSSGISSNATAVSTIPISVPSAW